MQEQPSLLSRPGWAERLRATSRLMALAAGLSLVVALTPVGSPADATEVRAITLPIPADQLGKVRWTDTYGAPRGGGRTHIGVDIMGPKMVPVIAARGGVVTWGDFNNAGGNYVRLRDDDGWEYQYIHLNNDTPGTDDGRAACTQAFSAKLCASVGANGRLARGTRVEEGELIGYLGDSGNAESTGAHLHFEIYRPNGTSVQPINPTPSVDAARARLSEAPAGPARTPAPVVPPAHAAPGEPGFADHLWFQLHGRYPTGSERAGFEAAVATDGVWKATARQLEQDSAVAAVDRLYQAFFLRQADTGGLRYWLNRRAQGVPLERVAENFAVSHEFQLRYGGRTFESFLDQLYLDVLGRQPDAQGKAYWLGELRSGRVTRGTIVVSFTESTEMRTLSALRSELVALHLAETGETPGSAEEAAWLALRQGGTSLPDAIAHWYAS